jgi:broad specificity phosphatase PhoE
MTEIFLIRHGESFANVEPIIGGMRGDAGLTPRGRRQVDLLVERLAASRFQADVLSASTLPRARLTAERVSQVLGLPVQYDDEWQELRPGAADGLSHDEARRRFGELEWMAANPYRPFAPDGESWALFLVRVGGALTRLVARHPAQRVVVVCHGGVQDASFYHAFGLGATAFPVRFAPANTSITHWRCEPGQPGEPPRWTLAAFNDAGHLAMEGLPTDTGHAATPTPVEEEN